MKLFKNNLDLIIVFVLTVLVRFPQLFNYCKLYIPFAFDTQALFTWDFAAVLGMFPYRDIFYPYGMLYFYRNTNFFFHIIHFLLTPILFVVVFYILKAVWRSKKVYYSLFIAFYFFVVTHTSEDAFVGYGVFVLFSALLGIFFYKRYEERKWSVLLVGIFLGLFFSLVHSQGTYMTGVFVLSLLLFPLLRDGFSSLLKPGYYYSRLVNILNLVCGVTLGLLPFFALLFLNQSLNDFFIFFLNLSDLTQYGKSPFFPYSKTPDNIFSFVIIISTILYLSYIYFYKNKKYEMHNYLEIGILLSILLMEQINIIRSIDWIITFASLFLLFILFYDLRNGLKAVGIKYEQIFIFLSLIVFSVFFIFGLHSDKNILKIESTTNLAQCIDVNVSEFYKTHPEYLVVKNELLKEMKNDEKIFSFPSDPIFYIIFSQRPPQYGNVYDSSSENAQNKQIDYLKDKHVKFVIYNTRILSTQDGVPDYARVPYESRFILNTFTPYKKIGDFLILKRMDSQDFFKAGLKDIQPLTTYLTHIDLAHIPRSEGLYKQNVLRSSRVHLDFSNLDALNSYLRQNKISSKNKLIIIRQKTNKDSTMTIKTSDNLETQISFKKCGRENVCIINLDVIPLFYKPRIITIVDIIPQDTEVQILEKPLKSNLW